MKHFSIIYNTQEELSEFINSNKINEYQDVLVQIFTSKNEIEYIQSLQKQVQTYLPYAELIGATTDGEISTEGLEENTTIFSISVFKKTKVKTTLVSNEGFSSYTLGEKVIQSFDTLDLEKTKIAFTFSDGLQTNGEKYLQGINTNYPDILLAGGMAGDRSTFTNSYVFTKDKITSNGAVMGILINPDICYCNDFSFDWEAIGPKHIVTKADENVVYTIDGISAVDFYKKYLGVRAAEALPAIGIEFPLISNSDGMEIARAVINKNDDGSLVFAGNIEEGAQVQFGFGNVKKIVYNGSKTLNSILDSSIEGIYIYSCMARKYLLGNDINIELNPLSKIANVAGFFTYGEFFYKDKHSYLLNQSMTVLGITESCGEDFYCGRKDINVVSYSNIDDSESVLRLEALSNLVTQTSRDFDQLNETLEKRVNEEVQKNLEKDAVLELNSKHAQLGEMMEMILHQWRQPLSTMKTIITGAQVEKEFGLLTEEKIKENRESLLCNIEHLNGTIHDFRDFFKQGDEKQKLQPSELLEKVKLFTYPLCKKENIEFKIDIQFNDPIEINSRKLVQALMNIVKNGIDALIVKKDSEKEFKTTITKEGNYLVIKLDDNAGGIPEHVLPSIFEKRFTTKNESGTGIGLYMTKTIIETHLHGTIEVCNTDKGAQFILTLPLEN